MRVVRTWTRTYDPALRVRAGDSLVVGPLDKEFPGWRWCSCTAGLGGWLSDDIVDTNAGRVLCDLDTAELTVAARETVTPGERRRGCTFCTHPDGRAGWMPYGCLSG